MTRRQTVLVAIALCMACVSADLQWSNCSTVLLTTKTTPCDTYGTEIEERQGWFLGFGKLSCEESSSRRRHRFLEEVEEVPAANSPQLRGRDLKSNSQERPEHRELCSQFCEDLCNMDPFHWYCVEVCRDQGCRRELAEGEERQLDQEERELTSCTSEPIYPENPSTDALCEPCESPISSKILDAMERSKSSTALGNCLASTTCYVCDIQVNVTCT
mmetsp:Transcript_17871/g.41861  ORF Transcript_17871/g.41861 Transcript_17871/m.41861 type:complete len:216 (+) Transcript_17871:229-876(+)|eukprot:CAMPEP_0168717518 /NCGR_PEP_ID=MMETSP0724-20121128/42_1 /TAXON_ID=265536 /ORGANISM="Amphiprora sp., Strain CCMP467" /LENGTH=215 /DNA_ID=CAMNT_0008763999 /DNA_START=170 /DNA_END=817 /DNA_ORIENTATION=+